MFEATLEGQEENFAVWDDYIEWKAYYQSERSLRKIFEELENVKTIRISDI